MHRNKPAVSALVEVLYPKVGYHWSRQMPPDGLEGLEFRFNPSKSDGDWLFVYEGLTDPVTTSVPKMRRVLVCGEPPSVKSYSARFLAQFGTIWTTDPGTDHPGAILHHPCTPWHVGAYRHPDRAAGGHMDITELADCEPQKTKLISVISSNKIATRGHRDRLAFVKRLKREFGDALDVYGRGINDFDDKWQALASYKYHIALENSSYLDYWTEKLADPILTLTYPIYFGCPNLEEYFGDTPLGRIDIADAEAAIRTIRHILDEDLYAARLADLKVARRNLIANHNLFAEISRHVAEHAIKQAVPLAKPEQIWPEKTFNRFKRAAKRLLRTVAFRAAR